MVYLISPRLRSFYSSLLITACIFLFLERAITFTFLGDDLGFLLFLHERAREGQLVNHVLSDFASTTLEADGNFYRPLAIASYALDYMLWGTNAGGWHLTNLVLHTLNSLLLFAVVQRILARVTAMNVTPIALLAALLFALRPLVGEVAIWIAGRPDALAQLGMMIALYSYLRWADGGRGWYGGAMGGFMMGLLSKETAAVLPGVLLALHLTGLVGRGDNFRARVRAALVWLMPFVLVLAAYLLLRYLLFGSFTQVYANDPYSYQWTDGLWWQEKTDALRFLISPTRIVSPIEFGVRYSLLATIGLALLLAVRFIAIRRIVAFALLWLAATILPILPALFINPWGEGERLLYSATAPLVVLLVSPLIPMDMPAPRWRGWQQAMTEAILVIALLVSTFWLTQRVNQWAQASDNMRSLIAALPARSAATPSGRTTILIVPETVAGVFFGRTAPLSLVSPPTQATSLSNLYIATAPYERPCQPSYPAFVIYAVACWHVPTRQFSEIDPTRYDVNNYGAFWELK